MKICVVGLGYVGLPLAVKFGILEKINGFDVNKKRIQELKKRIDSNNEVSKKELGKTKKSIAIKAKETLKKVKADLIGIVVNLVR